MQKYSTAGRDVELPSMNAEKSVSDVSADKGKHQRTIQNRVHLDTTKRRVSSAMCMQPATRFPNSTEGS